MEINHQHMYRKEKNEYEKYIKKDTYFTFFK